MKTLLVGAAIAAFVLVNTQGHDFASAAQFKPVIKKPRIIIKPDVTPQTKKMINKDPPSAVTKATKQPAGSETVKAGPQPEPPTLPAPGVGQASSTPSLPRLRPYNEFEEDDGIGGEIDAAEVLPPSLGVAPELEELLDVAGGNMTDIQDAASLLEDGPGGQNALPEIFGASGEFPGGIGGDRPFGGNRVGVMDPFGGRGEAFGPGGYNDGFGVDMTAGIPRSPASTAPGSGGKASSGWSIYTGVGTDGSTLQSSSRSNSQGGTDYRTVTVRTNGSMLIHETSTSGGPKGTETVTSDAIYDISAPDDKGNRIVEILKPDGSDGPTERSADEALVTGLDQDGDGQADGEVEEVIAIPVPAGGPAGQPTPEGGGAAEGLCAGWNPANGCGLPGLRIWETTGQPGLEDGSGTTRSAGASIGPEAVTNPDEFHSGSGSGGVQIDPCVAAGGGCGNGPDNPAASMEGAVPKSN